MVYLISTLQAPWLNAVHTGEIQMGSLRWNGRKPLSKQKGPQWLLRPGTLTIHVLLSTITFEVEFMALLRRLKPELLKVNIVWASKKKTIFYLDGFTITLHIANFSKTAKLKRKEMLKCLFSAKLMLFQSKSWLLHYFECHFYV